MLCIELLYTFCSIFLVLPVILCFDVQTNLIKESIRMGYNDFGDFYYSHGQLGDAFKSYVRTRDYCTTSKHITQMCLNVILVSIELGQFMHVSNYVSKAEQTPDSQDPVTVAKLKCALGLAFLETKKYKLAARKVGRYNFICFIYICSSLFFVLHSLIVYTFCESWTSEECRFGFGGYIISSAFFFSVLLWKYLIKKTIFITKKNLSSETCPRMNATRNITSCFDFIIMNIFLLLSDHMLEFMI